ncbi:hypothetical protein H9I45_08555 [Polaribacter haliotis]|uniref:Uncharacterized protein n=1 Tax=Polaribacter haliotis TaxID=1888915 RepID=A0A7L8ABN3_9FLAO|nr:hypothetical protein [Polaribacter haliotis]QOD59423.1 hypothetical protein H9I45_08555 [Polaribacter haliotis]
MKNILLILTSILIVSCNSEKKGIESGTFDLYENDSIVGTIYRIKNFQIEKNLDNSELIAQVEYQTDSTYLVSGIEKKKIGIDSIIWLNTYKKITENKYQIVAKPNNSNLEYEYRAILLKTQEKIPKEYADKLNKLNEK